jgi:hypothetical protein
MSKSKNRQPAKPIVVMHHWLSGAHGIRPLALCSGIKGTSRAHVSKNEADVTCKRCLKVMRAQATSFVQNALVPPLNVRGYLIVRSVAGDTLMWRVAGPKVAVDNETRESLGLFKSLREAQKFVREHSDAAALAAALRVSTPMHRWRGDENGGRVATVCSGMSGTVVAHATKIDAEVTCKSCLKILHSRTPPKCGLIERVGREVYEPNGEGACSFPFNHEGPCEGRGAGWLHQSTCEPHCNEPFRDGERTYRCTRPAGHDDRLGHKLGACEHAEKQLRGSVVHQRDFSLPSTQYAICTGAPGRGTGKTYGLSELTDDVKLVTCENCKYVREKTTTGEKLASEAIEKSLAKPLVKPTDEEAAVFFTMVGHLGTEKMDALIATYQKLKPTPSWWMAGAVGLMGAIYFMMMGAGATDIKASVPK